MHVSSIVCLDCPDQRAVTRTGPLSCRLQPVEQASAAQPSADTSAG